MELLRDNLHESSIPTEIFNMDFNQYNEFLELRRKQMATENKRVLFLVYSTLI